jgi:TetR/AcrR family transcriptional regulator, copper-responsive repressor
VPRGRPRSFDRDEALERALAAFWEHGYETASVSLLTRAMGLSPASLYAAFGDKRQLFGEAVDRYLQTYGAFTAAAVRDEPTAYGTVARMLREATVVFTSPEHPPGCLLITAATNCARESADVKARLRDLRTANTDALEQKIAAGLRAGELPPETDPRAVAVFYMATLQGMSAQARDGATRTDLEHIATTALKAWPGPAARTTVGDAASTGETVVLGTPA